MGKSLAKEVITEIWERPSRFSEIDLIASIVNIYGNFLAKEESQPKVPNVTECEHKAERESFQKTFWIYKT